MNEKITYTPSNLPPLKTGTDGHLRPKPEGRGAVCMAPIAVDYPFPANWGKGPGATMPVPAGGFISALGVGDSYYNREFTATSTLTGKILDPATDPRAAELASFFAAKGLSVLVLEAVKTVGVDVLGEVAAEAIGHDLLTPEGPVVIAVGDVIVQSPRTGDIYRISPEKRVKRYAMDGRVFEGPLPPDCR
jgi:hypothetical protein